MNIQGFSDKGMVRDNNQDAFMTGELSENAFFAVVCDGMGGANGGNIASRLAVDHFSAALKVGFRANMSESSVKNLLNSAVGTANVRVFDKSRESQELNGMGTTIVSVLTIGATAYFIHAGDSRAYVFGNGELQQITRDHSIVQSMIENGKLSLDEARHHPRKNVITRALGVDESVTPEFNVYDLSKGETILLCSDGLTNFADGDEIVKVLSSDSKTKAEDLISIANKNGGGDNITAVVLENI